MSNALNNQIKLSDSVSVKDFGADPTGVTNSTAAFAAAAAYINSIGGGTIVIPFGTYTVGLQTFAGANGLGYAYRPADILNITGCTKPVVIRCEGAKIRMASGLRFGSFDPVTGLPNSPGMPNTNLNYAADTGLVFQFYNNSGGVSVLGSVEIDGNNTNTIIGGQWGDTGYQRLGYGVWEYGNASFYIENVYTHHNCTDGIVCGYTGAVAGGPKTPKTLINVISELNGRQGLSWTGGNGLTAINCKFNRSGRAINAGTGVALASSPGAGVDIEASSAVCRDGVFINCEMINNTNTALVADSGDSADVRFINCVFGGIVWPKKPGFKFQGCKFYGGVVNPYGNIDPQVANVFDDCLFTDITINDYTFPVVLGTLMFPTTLSAPIYLNRCTINATRCRPGRTNFWNISNCRFTFSFPGTAVVNDTDYVIDLNGAVLQNNTFDANITVNPPASGYSLLNAGLATTIGSNNLTNTAGIVRWSSWSTGGGGYIGQLGNAGSQTIGSKSLSLFPNAYTTQYYGTMDIYAGSAAPASGTYKRGDRVINQAPAVGQPKAWVCTVAGTPGTWVSEGNL